MSVAKPADGTPSWWSSHRASAYVALTIVFLSLAAAHALMVAPLYPGDERGHVGYALVVSEGRLPEMTTPMPSNLYPRLDSGFETVWLANHPPLYYVVVAAPLRLTAELGDGDGGLRATRLITALLGAAIIPLAAWTTRLLLPQRTELALIAAAAASLLATVPHIFGIVHNDALAVALGATAFGLGLQILLKGSTARAWWLLGTVTCLAMLTRLSSLVPCAFAGGLAVVGLMLEERERGGTRIRWLWRPAAVILAVLVTSGWFYLRNIHLYGDLTGMDRLSETFGLQPDGTIIGRLTSGAFLLDQHDQLWARMAGGAMVLDRGALLAARAMALTVVIGLVVTCARARRWPSLRPLIAWTAVVALVPTLVVTVAQHAAAGGGPHARYLMPGLGALGALVAASYAGWPSRVRRALAPASFIVALGLNVVALHAMLVRQATRISPEIGRGPLSLERELLSAAGVPLSQVALGILIACGTTAAAVVCIEMARR